jgi:hypothetical protein
MLTATNIAMMSGLCRLLGEERSRASGEDLTGALLGTVQASAYPSTAFAAASHNRVRSSDRPSRTSLPLCKTPSIARSRQSIVES